MSDEAAKTLPPHVVEAIRGSRRFPRLSQYDYLHLRYLRDDLQTVLRGLEPPPRRVLDVFCGTRPYDDFFPPTAECIGFDMEGNPYGTADVVSDEFLPFPDASFDLVTCIQAFYYLANPVHGAQEIWRVLRPGGVAVITVPFVWGYERNHLEHRFSETALAYLFRDWEITIIESGGWTASWVTVTTSMVRLIERRARRRLLIRNLVRPVFAGLYVALNVGGILLGKLERRHDDPPVALPTNLLLIARKPRAAGS
jgi:SAM-dependent methyltransferase